MHEREVAEVGEVLDLARGVARPPVRPAVDGRPGGILELGNLGQRPARLLERNPDHPVALGAGERGRARLGGHARRVGELRDPGAGSVGAVAPAVVRAHDLVALDRAERERGAAMDAEVEERVRRPGAVPPEDECLAEQVDGERLARPRARPSTRPDASTRGAPVHGRRRTARSCARAYAAGSVTAVTGAADARSEYTDGISTTPTHVRMLSTPAMSSISSVPNATASGPISA